ncbi:MAG: WYL domain-containing protein [Spirochaetales bacterium]
MTRGKITASHRKAKVRVEYQGPGCERALTRVLHPDRLTLHRGAWYLLGIDEFREDVRVFSLSRLQTVSREKDRDCTSDDFVPESYLDPQFGNRLGHLRDCR